MTYTFPDEGQVLYVLSIRKLNINKCLQSVDHLVYIKSISFAYSVYVCECSQQNSKPLFETGSNWFDHLQCQHGTTCTDCFTVMELCLVHGIVEGGAFA